MATTKQVERDVHQWFRAHHGVITRAEALRLGMSTAQIRSKVASADWVLMHRGVYRHAAVDKTPYQSMRGACAATTGAGVISHSSAAWLWGLVTTEPTRPELSVPAGSGRRIDGLTIHRCADLDSNQAVWRKEILVTNPLRTLVDLAGVAPPAVLTDAVDAAQAKKLVTVEGLVAELDRLSRRGRTGVGSSAGTSSTADSSGGRRRASSSPRCTASSLRPA